MQATVHFMFKYAVNRCIRCQESPRVGVLEMSLRGRTRSRRSLCHPSILQKTSPPPYIFEHPPYRKKRKKRKKKECRCIHVSKRVEWGYLSGPNLLKNVSGRNTKPQSWRLPRLFVACYLRHTKKKRKKKS